MLNPDDPLVRWAQFGRQMEHWLETDVGRYIAERMAARLNDAVEKLKRAPIEEFKELQIRIQIIEGFMADIAESIDSGRSALEELKNAAH